MNERIVVISVIRDHAIYKRLIENNPNLGGCVLVPIDNSEDNKAIPVRYNRFLSDYDYDKPAWFVFCHEDYEFLEPLQPVLSNRDKNALYGQIGAITVKRFGFLHQWQFCGIITGSARDGGNKMKVGCECPALTPVDTFDCCCMAVHSDTVKRTGLRFDEKLTYDLYIEDFCINAKVSHGIPSLILPCKVHHYSDSLPKARYYQREKYINSKYRSGWFTSTSSFYLGNPPLFLRIESAVKRWILKHCGGLADFLRRLIS